jgi:hypothetical protein
LVLRRIKNIGGIMGFLGILAESQLVCCELRGELREKAHLVKLRDSVILGTNIIP